MTEGRWRQGEIKEGEGQSAETQRQYNSLADSEPISPLYVPDRLTFRKEGGTQLCEHQRGSLTKLWGGGYSATTSEHLYSIIVVNIHRCLIASILLGVLFLNLCASHTGAKPRSR